MKTFMKRASIILLIALWIAVPVTGVTNDVILATAILVLNIVVNSK